VQTGDRRGAEAEARVVRGLAEDDGEAGAGAACGLEPVGHEPGADAAPVQGGQYRQRRQPEAGHRGTGGHRTERDVSDDPSTLVRHQRHGETPGGPQRVDQPGLAVGRERGQVDGADRVRVAGPLRPHRHDGAKSHRKKSAANRRSAEATNGASAGNVPANQ